MAKRAAASVSAAGQSGSALTGLGSVLVCDPIAADGIEALRAAGARVDVRTQLPPDELLRAVPEYDALIVRSETRITGDVIEAGRRLRVIGRAGVGVDNIDIATATRAGIVVVNAPQGNTISAAEHTIGLMLALARHIPQGHVSMQAGRWERARFVGTELRGKTLGVVGLGQVGSEVARRARGLEMRVIAHDPFVPEERARALGVELCEFDELLRQSDFISVHTTLTPTTKELIGERELRKVKPTARLINTARGGIIDERALLRAVEEGRVAGAAIDVFAVEPAVDNPLAGNERIIVTPHLGASTAEAQERVALDVAEQVASVLRGEPALYAVNAPFIAPETLAVVGPYIEVAEKAGAIATQLALGQLERIEFDFAGEIAQHDTTPLRAAAIRGLLSPITEENVTIVNANAIAESRGLRITEHKSPAADTYTNLVTVIVATSSGRTSVSTTRAPDAPHLVMIDEFRVDIPLTEGYLLVCDNQDKPGMIGRVGTLLGDFDINISSMDVGRAAPRDRACMVLGLDEPPSEAALETLRQVPDIYSARVVRL